MWGCPLVVRKGSAIQSLVQIYKGVQYLIKHNLPCGMTELFQAEHPWFLLHYSPVSDNTKPFAGPCWPITCLHHDSTSCPAADKRTFWELITFYFYMTDPSLWVARSLWHVSLAPGNYQGRPHAAGVRNPRCCTGCTTAQAAPLRPQEQTDISSYLQKQRGRAGRGGQNHVLGLLFSIENRWPDPAPTAELSTNKGVRLEACAHGGAEDLAHTPAFAKGQDNLT